MSKRERAQSFFTLHPHRNILFWLLWLIFEQATAFKRLGDEAYKLLRPSLCRFVGTRHIQSCTLQRVGLFEEHHSDNLHAVVTIQKPLRVFYGYSNRSGFVRVRFVRVSANHVLDIRPPAKPWIAHNSSLSFTLAYNRKPAAPPLNHRHILVLRLAFRHRFSFHKRSALCLSYLYSALSCVKHMVAAEQAGIPISGRRPPVITLFASWVSRNKRSWLFLFLPIWVYHSLSAQVTQPLSLQTDRDCSAQFLRCRSSHPEQHDPKRNYPVRFASDQPERNTHSTADCSALGV